MAFAWVFPGQGAQSVGMGRALWEASPAARTLYAQADDLLGRPLSRLCFEGPEEVLRATVNAQPALFVTSLACLAALQEAWGGPLPAPRCLAGHSLGELTALVAAGALAFAEGLRLVQERGRLMQQAGEQQQGTMAAVLGLTREAVEAACQAVQDHGPVVVANDNAPGQVVVSGTPEAVAAVVERLRQAGARRIVPLNVSGAFHSPLMATAAAAFAALVEGAAIGDPQVPVISNVTAEPLTSAAAVRHELRQHLLASVRWAESVRTMARLGVTRVLEIGPGTVLSGLIRRTVATIETYPVGTPAEIAAVVARLGQEEG